MDTDDEMVITANMIINNCAKLLLNRRKIKQKEERKLQKKSDQFSIIKCIEKCTNISKFNCQNFVKSCG